MPSTLSPPISDQAEGVSVGCFLGDLVVGLWNGDGEVVVVRVGEVGRGEGVLSGSLPTTGMRRSNTAEDNVCLLDGEKYSM